MVVKREPPMWAVTALIAGGVLALFGLVRGEVTGPQTLIVILLVSIGVGRAFASVVATRDREDMEAMVARAVEQGRAAAAAEAAAEAARRR
jgi:hypothetical protein